MTTSETFTPRERVPDRTVVWLRGEHDASTVEMLQLTLARAMAADDLDLVVDMSGIEFMGSATVGVLAATRQRLAQQSRTLTVRCPSPPARRVLDLCRVPISA